MLYFRFLSGAKYHKARSAFGVFQGSCRVNRLTTPLFSPGAALDPDLAAPFLLASGFAFVLTSVPGSSFALARTVRAAAPGSDDPVCGAAQRV